MNLSFLTTDPGLVTASATSSLATLSLAAGAIPIPDSTPAWLPYAVTVLGPILALIVKRLFAASAAKKRSLAGSKRRRAEALRLDANPANDAEAVKLDDDADALEAAAQAQEALRG